MKLIENPLFKIPFRFGLIGGLIGSLVIVVLFFIGKHPFLIPIVFDFRIVIYAMFIFMTLKVVRDNYLHGSLLFWQGMVGGYVFLAIAGLTGALTTFVFAIVHPNFLTDYINNTKQQLIEFKKEFIAEASIEEYQQQLSQLSNSSAFDLASDYFLKSLFIGLFLAIVISVILRKKQTNPL